MSNTPYTTTSSSANLLPGPCDVGASSSDTIGFFGTTPVAKQGSSALATLSLGTIQTSGYGFATKADGDALVAQVEAITAALVAYGIVKQS